MRLSVLTYNVLHEFGAARLLRGRAGTAGGGSPAWARDRLARVAELVQQLDPDVACLQELDAAGEAAVTRALGGGFERTALRNETLPPGDGCATFVRTSRFEVLRAQPFRLRDAVEAHFPPALELRGGAGLAAALWRELHEKLSVAVALRLRARCAAGAGEEAGKDGRGAEVCVATAHLLWDPRYPDLKLLQAFFLARALEREAGADAGARLAAPLVLAADLNSTPLAEDGGHHSGVYALLTRGHVPPSHPHHPVALRPGKGVLRGVSPADVPELQVAPFQSAYAAATGGEPPVTNASRGFRGCLDYVLFRDAAAAGVPPPAAAGGAAGGGAAGVGGSPARLRLLGVRPLPPPEALPAPGAAGGSALPSPEHPSDHLPLLAEFELSAGEAA